MSDENVSDKKPTRRDLLKPAQLLGISAAIALFGFVVTLFSTGGFSRDTLLAIEHGQWNGPTPLELALIFGGIAFIATLLIMALLMLAVDPVDVTKTVGRGILLDEAPADEAVAVAQSDAAGESVVAEVAEAAAAEASDPEK